MKSIPEESGRTFEAELDWFTAAPEALRSAGYQLFGLLSRPVAA
jgi:hypothetical protein